MGLPKIMVAPNGAHRMPVDHALLPVTIPALCDTARTCFDAGAGGIHIHVRDEKAKHSLDVGLYNEALAELTKTVPNMILQITSEAGGVFGPEKQRDTVLQSHARFASVAAKEMALESDIGITQKFYLDCENHGIAVQHIIYEPADLDALAGFIAADALHAPTLQLLFVLGRYTTSGAEGPDALTPFLNKMHELHLSPDWAVCAFGQQETNCLIEAEKQGGKMRIGFENSFINQDGSIAQSNAERVAEIARLTAD